MAHSNKEPQPAISNYPTWGCTDTRQSDLGKVLGEVGTFYSQGSGVTATFHYAGGASNTLGIGLSSSGAWGSYSLDGTTSTSTTATQGFPQVSGAYSVAFNTYFEYGKYKAICYNNFTGQTSVYYFVLPYQWDGGADDIYGTYQPAAGDCIPEPPGSDWTAETNSTATTASGGAETYSLIGVNLSSQSGYTTSSTTYIYFSTGHPLCGVSNYPGATSPGPGKIQVHTTILY